MNEFADLLSRIGEAIAFLNVNGCDIPFFRGHGSCSWDLRPTIARRPSLIKLESHLYYDVLTRSGSLIPANSSSWDILFIMQHHRIPTRLLDWTENFAIALHFALCDFRDRAAIWVLNPFELNRQQINDPSLLHPQSDIQGEYFEFFITKETTFEPKPDVIAVLPNKTNQRVLAQKAVFTLHWNLQEPLEKICPDAVMKFEFSQNALSEASKFLQLAGVNEYSLFPDLDGLARWMKACHGF